MRFSFRKYVYPLSICCILFINSCIGPGNGGQEGNAQASQDQAAKSEQTEIKDDIAELMAIINIPFEPEEAKWYEEEIEGSGKKIRAVLFFYKEDLPKLELKSSQDPPQQVEFDLEKWFPEELVAENDISGDQKLRGAIYSAEAFFSENYKKGSLIKIEGTEFFLLELTNF